MKLTTHLISGAGNTFHICYGVPLSSDEVRRRISMKICAEQPADGFIFLTESSDGFRWEFYNNDGSRAEMCGNATRCVGLYAKNILHSPLESWNLATAAGNVNIRSISSEMYRIVMTPITLLESSHGFYADTGVPHLVLHVQNYAANPELRATAAILRHHQDFMPKGTNVTFVSFGQSISSVTAISFERGVEDFTLACGTGAAAAAAYNLKFRGALQTEVEMPGGSLIMDLTDLQRPVMTGPAALLGSYEYEISE